jgi:hypothetical protein
MTTTPIIYLQKIELKTLAKLKTQYPGQTTQDVTNLFYYKEQKQLGFVNIVGTPVTENATVTLWYYRRPLSDGSETISDSIEPIIDDRWDDYLVFYACYLMTGDPKFLAQSKDEMNEIRPLQLAQVDRTAQIAVNRDYD